MERAISGDRGKRLTKVQDTLLTIMTSHKSSSIVSHSREQLGFIDTVKPTLRELHFIRQLSQDAIHD